MNIAKSAGGILLIVLIIGAAVSYFLKNNLDDIVKDLVEESASRATQTAVTVEGVQIDLLTGKGQISGLTIANPPGFESPYAFRVESAMVEIDLNTISEPVIVISQFNIDGATIIAEQRGTDTNLSQLKKNLEQSAHNDKSPPSSDSEDSAPANLRLMMERFALTHTQATVVTQRWGEQSVELPDVKRNDIGDTSTGFTPDQLGGALLQELIGSLERATQSYLAKLAQDELSKKLKDQLKDKLNVDADTVDGALQSLFDKIK